MSRLTDLIAQAKANNPELGKELEREFKVLSSRRSFGLNFERHKPESVELPGRPVRKGDKVRVLPPRGTTKKGDERLWRVLSISRKGKKQTANLELVSEEKEQQLVDVVDLVVVAEFRDYIYPGLVSTGKVERGGSKPYHAVINGENFHVLEALTFTHRGKVDVIYIDPPYNTGAKDWKYNNDYVEAEDLYRHSKWLAMMERRLLVAKELLNPNESVLIVTIDEKEYLRLGLLLEQTFPEARIQMISSAINPKGSSRTGFRRSDEYLFIVMFGGIVPSRLNLSSEWSIYYNDDESDSKSDVDLSRVDKATPPEWTSMMRRGTSSLRKDVPNGFYPIYVDPTGTPRVVEVGEPLPAGVNEAPVKKGLVAVLPLRSNGEQGRWQVVRRTEFLERLKQGRIRVGKKTKYGYVINYLPDGAYKAVCSNAYHIEGRADDGSLIAWKMSSEDGAADDNLRVPTTQWHVSSHNASENGTTLINAILGRLRAFDYAKSLYAVEDLLRFFVTERPNAIVLDFFAGSGTTAHALMRLNKLDNGSRQSILVTNNEVSADVQKGLRKSGLRPGDSDWEKLGICDYITKPRIAASITGITPDGDKIKGEYKFNDIFPMSQGLLENAEFFTLTYETPIAIGHNKAFGRIAPLLWMRAGSIGRRIESLPKQGFDVADTYGLLVDLDKAAAFCKVVEASEGVIIAYIVTDDDRRFQSVARRLPDSVEPVRLYESYLNNFRFSFGR